MSDEKKIRVSVTGDASALNAEIDRATIEMRGSFEDIGFDQILEDADKKFDKLTDKIKAINDAFKTQHERAEQHFDERGEKATNDYGKNKNEKEREDYHKKEQEAWDKWSKLADALLKKQTKDGKPEAGLNGEDEDDEEDGKKGSSKKRAGVMARMIDRMKSGDVTGAASEGIQGEGGLIAQSGMGAGSGMVIGGILVAMVGAIVAAIKMGYEGVKLDNKMEAKKRLDYDDFGTHTGLAQIGVSPNEFKEFTIQQMQNMRTAGMSIEQLENEINSRLYVQKAYGLQGNEVAAFDKFKQQDITNANGSQMITDILLRSEQNGILGVSGTDFSLLPQKIETVANLMAMQKQSNETVDPDFAINLMAAGSGASGIGGRYGDDRAGDAYGRMSGNIKSPGSTGMKAFIFEMLKRANPNASYVDILAEQEGGLTNETMKAILPQIARMPQGDYRRMVLKQLTGNWQDAVRLDDVDEKGVSGIQKMLSSGSKTTITNADREKVVQEAKSEAEHITTSFEKVGSMIATTFQMVGHDIVKAFDGSKQPQQATPDSKQKSNTLIKGGSVIGRMGR